ncbi:MAG: glycosyltransferase [Synergistaceae bacterium]|nr:glycosyltransferase [Synergistaceae bacterium]
MIELSIMMPCYEEGENLKILLPKINNILKKFIFELEIIIVDTETPKDSTPEICAEFENVRYIPRIGGNNYGDAIRTGINSCSGKYIIIMDADSSHNPEDITRLYETVTTKNFDVVAGSRYTKGGSTDNPFILRLMSRVLNICYKFSFGLKIHDVSDSFRIYDAAKLKAIKLTCDNFDIVEEILIKLVKKFPDVKIAEIPISFNQRLYGESKRDLFKFICSYIATMYRLKKLQGESI